MNDLSPAQITWIYTFAILMVGIVSFFITMVISTVITEFSRVRQARWAAFGQRSINLEKHMEDLK